MTERELRERLTGMLDADDAGAEDRAWEVVRAIYAQKPAVGPARRPRRLAAAVVAVVVAATTITLASAAAPRHAVTRWLRQAVGLSSLPRAHPALAALPGGGELLINSRLGPWVVHPDGSRRNLGRYTGASWSPRALFAVAWQGSELVAIDPRGHPRWALDRAGRISVARWSPDGYRVAYIAAGALRVVAGDGTSDHLLSANAGPIAPAWRPGVGIAHILTFINGHDEIETRAVDTGALLWGTRPTSRPTQILWSADGQRLLIVTAHALSLYNPSGKLLAIKATDPGSSIGQATFAPSGHAFVIVRHQSTPASDSVVMRNATPNGLRDAARVLFSSAGTLTDVAWSPDDRWLLVASPTADQWIFVPTPGGARLIATSQIATQFDPGGKPPLEFPTVAGWQP